jgi:cell division protein FtsW (lipid II flippase)
MTTTRESMARTRPEPTGGRNRELVFLLIFSALAGTGLWLVESSKTREFAEYAREVAAGEVFYISRHADGAALARHLRRHAPAGDFDFVARRIANAARDREGLPNVGTLALLTVSERDVKSARGLSELPRRLEAAREQRKRAEASESWWERWKASLPGAEAPPLRVPLLSRQEVANFKPDLVVRQPGDWSRSFRLWIILFFAGFYVVHIFWRVARFRGDDLLLPIVHLLCGLGLILMVSLRDPLRDTLAFQNFAAGVFLGCLILAPLSLLNFELRTGRFAYLWLALAIVLALALVLFGSGPGSGAKVNLLGFQPVEIIRLLTVLFLAAYFGSHWNALRHLTQEQGPGKHVAQALRLGRLDYSLPVLAGVAVSLSLFFFLHDLGPALVIGALFLVLFSLAANAFRLAMAGFALVFLGFAFGALLHVPHTVYERVQIWLSVWNNPVPGGDQVAHSLWSLAAGAVTGTGLGLGTPEEIPAAHTDLVLSALGEQLGFIGLLAVFGLYFLFFARVLKIARGAGTGYSFFLVAGLGLITALQLLLISAGILGLLPLSGVVSPFLSYGRTSMLANFALLAMILAVSHHSRGDQTPFFGRPLARIAGVLAAGFAAVLGAAAYYQTWRADDTLVRGSLVIQADGQPRYQYNPRIRRAAREIPKGDIYDRNGLPLATSDWDKVEAQRGRYNAAGVNLEETSSRFDRRHYPLGAPLFYLLGDVRTRLKRGASNTSFEESDSRIRLQGYEDGAQVEDYIDPTDPAHKRVLRRIRYDYRELIPLVRHHWEPDNPAVKELRERPRDVKLTVDARFEMRAARILETGLRRLKCERGAVVAIDPRSGELLAAVSYPWPSPAQLYPLRAQSGVPVPNIDLQDRVRFGLYPPGSSFKIVTAVAALRKDPALFDQAYECIRLPDGRVGNFIPGQRRPIRDDAIDRVPHGHVTMAKGITVSCNAYFAQLGALGVGPKALFDAAALFQIEAAVPNTPKELARSIAQSSYGQGEVRARPVQMARVAGTIANAGLISRVHWVLDPADAETGPPQRALDAALAQKIAAAMRAVVTSGTGSRVAKTAVPVAGKTGTAELEKRPSHAWFIGYAPYGAPEGKQIAFAVLVENGGYGGIAAAPLAAELVNAARELGII